MFGADVVFGFVWICALCLAEGVVFVYVGRMSTVHYLWEVYVNV